MQHKRHDSYTTETRCEIGDLYFWLGEEAERVGFTPWQTAWVAYPATMIGASNGGPSRVKELLAAQRRIPPRPLTERDELMNMVFGADNDGEWMTEPEWQEYMQDG